MSGPGLDLKTDPSPEIEPVAARPGAPPEPVRWSAEKGLTIGALVAFFIGGIIQDLAGSRPALAFAAVAILLGTLFGWLKGRRP